MANGDIDLSVGSVLALSGAVAAVIMKDTDLGAARGGRRARSPSACSPASINGWLTAYVGLPAFIATLGTFYWARGIGSSIVAGTQLNGFPESFNLIGRSLYRIARRARASRPQAAVWLAIAKAVSVQTIFVHRGRGHRRHRARQDAVRPEGLRDRRQRARGEFRRHQHAARALHRRWSSPATCAAFAGVIYDAFYRSFIPTAGQLRELDAISSIIIGGGSIFGGYGTMIGSLAGRGVITLDPLAAVAADHPAGRQPRSCCRSNGRTCSSARILIVAVVGDIWLRQNNIFGDWFGRRAARTRAGARIGE